MKTQSNPRFVCVVSSTSLTDVSKWLSSFYKAILHVVNDLWVSKLGKAHVHHVSSWILNDFTGAVDLIKSPKFLRSADEKSSPLWLQSFEFSTLRTKINLVDLKAHMKVTVDGPWTSERLAVVVHTATSYCFWFLVLHFCVLPDSSFLIWKSFIDFKKVLTLFWLS